MLGRKEKTKFVLCQGKAGAAGIRGNSGTPGLKVAIYISILYRIIVV